jgi:DNA-binding CsgD family transcriptional regulator
VQTDNFLDEFAGGTGQLGLTNETPMIRLTREGRAGRFQIVIHFIVESCNVHNLLQSETNLSAGKPPRTSGGLDEAMMRQFRTALNTLLFYLRNPNEKMENSNGAEAAPNSLRELTEITLRETTRVAELLSRLEWDAKASTGALISVATDRERRHSWDQKRNLQSASSATSPGGSSCRSVLSPREREVLALVVGGSSSRVGGPQLGISNRTFEVHRANIIKKLGAKNTADLVRLVMSES